MPVYPTTTRLINVDENSLDNLLSEIIDSGIDFEILNPKELSSQWESVIFLESNTDDQLKKLLQSTENILEKNQPKKGLLASLSDDRVFSNPEELRKVGNNFQELKTAIENLTLFNNLKSELNKILNLKDTYKGKKILIVKDSQLSSSQFKSFLDDILSKAKTIEVSDLSEIETPQVEILQTEKHSLIIYSPQDENLINEFLKGLNSQNETVESEKYILQLNQNLNALRTQNQTLIDSKGILTPHGRKSLSLLHAYCCKLLASQELRKNVFKIRPNTQATFLFLSTPNSGDKKLIEILEKTEVFSQEVDWSTEIVDWQNPGALNSFQGVAQSIGTIDKKEADPTIGVAVFFMIFFAFCLADAVYGLIVSAFTGYYLFAAKPKPGIKPMFNIFFYSGLIAMVLGIITNSWAGNFFNSDLFKSVTGHSTLGGQSTVINDFLSNFQLIEILGTQSQAPVNQAIGDTSPIIVMMLIALFIGFLNQILGYYYRLKTNINYKKWGIVLGQLAWIGFLTVGIVSIAINAVQGFLPQAYSFLLYLSLLMLLIFNQAKSIPGKILGFLLGPRGLYGVMQLGANLISYVRIVAIGLTGSIIAIIVNLLAGLVYDAGGVFLGLILAIVILLIGHLFNFVLSVFGAYINPLRLTYVEFMPGFFEGNGRQLESHKPEFKYLRFES